MAMPEPGLTATQRSLKRPMDLVIAVRGVISTTPMITVAVAVATIDTRECGIPAQKRIGRYGRPFAVYKFRTMRHDPAFMSTATSTTDRRITASGRDFRQFKIDELPQVFDVLRAT